MPLNRRRKELLSLERLRKLFSYNPDTGLFTVLQQTGGRKVGSIIGRPIRRGDHIYSVISIDGHSYPAHQIAWFMFYGSFVREGYEIDHKNRIRSDNRISNLREATFQQNKMNRGPPLHDGFRHVGIEVSKEEGSELLSKLFL